MSSKTFLLLEFLLAIVLLISSDVVVARDFAENISEYKFEETKDTDEVYDLKGKERSDNGRFGPRPTACKSDETKETDKVYYAKYPREIGYGRFTPRLAISNCMPHP